MQKASLEEAISLFMEEFINIDTPDSTITKDAPNATNVLALSKLPKKS
nr:hypothetical protein [Enterovibrio nigricans]